MASAMSALIISIKLDTCAVALFSRLSVGEEVGHELSGPAAARSNPAALKTLLYY